jgi:phosphomannomutase/phosphoglucomutase
VAVRVNQQLALLQSTVEGVADQDYVRAALRGEASLSAAAANLAKVLPDIEAVYLFPYGDIPRTSSEPTLGFSGLDLARRAETGQRLFPDAFPRNGQWYLQMSTPVRNPQSRAVTGSVLVVFDAARLQPLMTGVNSALGGEFSLVQSVNGSTLTGSSDTNLPLPPRRFSVARWLLCLRWFRPWSPQSLSGSCSAMPRKGCDRT